MKVVGLTGYAGSGKDYVCDTLKGNYEAVRVAFADGVRLEIEETLLARSPGQRGLEALWHKPYPDEIRRLLQWWGTEYRRAEDENYWVKKGIERIEDVYEFYDLVVVTDVRFGNEADAIHALGGIVLEVTASEDVRRQRLGGQLPPAHASEVIDFEVDGTIRNDDDTYVPTVLVDYLDGLEKGRWLK